MIKSGIMKKIETNNTTLIDERDGLRGNEDSKSGAERIVAGSRVEFDTQALAGSMNNTWNKIVSGMRRRRTPLPMWVKAVAVAASATIVIAGGMFVLNSHRTPVEVVANDTGHDLHMTLPDGSQVWLYYGAVVSYPEKFDEHVRRISLRGEAFFDVAHLEQSRFIVSGELLEVEALGTRFNVASDEDTARVVLESGSVGISRMDGSQIVGKAILRPGEMGVVARGGFDIRTEPVDTQLYTSWKDDHINIKSQTLENVMRMLSKRYNVAIHMMGVDLRQETFTGRFAKTQTLEEIFGIINITTPVNYEYRNGAWIITPRHLTE